MAALRTGEWSFEFPGRNQVARLTRLYFYTRIRTQGANSQAYLSPLSWRVYCSAIVMPEIESLIANIGPWNVAHWEGLYQ